MDALLPLVVMGLAFFGIVAGIAGYESRDGFEDDGGFDSRDR